MIHNFWLRKTEVNFITNKPVLLLESQTKVDRYLQNVLPRPTITVLQ